MEVNVHEIIAREARSHAIRIFKEDKTVGLTCDNMRRRLQMVDRDPCSPYFGKGRSCYNDYVKILTENVDRIYAEHGMRVRYEVPKYGDPTTFKIVLRRSH